jgi:hypothetical protein
MLMQRWNYFFLSLFLLLILSSETFAVEYLESLDRLSVKEKERVLLWTAEKTHPELCHSTKEFKEALNFFRVKKSEINPSEGRARLLAAEIAKGCDGAAMRFAKTYTLLKKSGVDIGKCIDTAIRFSKEDDETVENFFELFHKTYLSEFFDFDYYSALQISYEISSQYKGNRKQSREDFVNVLNYCNKKDEMNLPMKTCAEVSLAMARLSQHYPDGVFKPFVDLFTTLKNDKRFGVSIRVALSILLDVLPNGPTAPQNFLDAFDYALSTAGLGVDGREALQFALSMSIRSARVLPPPIYIPQRQIVLANGKEAPPIEKPAVAPATPATYTEETVAPKKEYKPDTSR